MRHAWGEIHGASGSDLDTFRLRRSPRALAVAHVGIEDQVIPLVLTQPTFCRQVSLCGHCDRQQRPAQQQLLFLLGWIFPLPRQREQGSHAHTDAQDADTKHAEYTLADQKFLRRVESITMDPMALAAV